jgi:hypothetical protein
LNSLFVNISLGAGKILTFWHHMIITIPADLWGLITHISFSFIFVAILYH